MTSLSRIDGIAVKFIVKLKSYGILSIEDLLMQGCNPNKRFILATNSGINAKLLLKWIHHADLLRIKGIYEEHAYLLELAEIHTMAILENQNPEELHCKLQELNNQKKLVRHMPSLQEVEDWIIEAKTIPKIIK